MSGLVSSVLANPLNTRLQYAVWCLWTTVITASVLGAISDIKTRLVSNRLISFVFVVGFVVRIYLSMVFNGFSFLIDGVIGSLAGFLVFLPSYAKNNLGAGDIKMMGAIGMCMGLGIVTPIAVLSMLFGGILAFLELSFAKVNKGVPYIAAIAAGVIVTCYVAIASPTTLLWRL